MGEIRRNRLTNCRYRLALLGALALSGCSTETGILTGAIVGTVFGARAPIAEIEQIYYLGVFDPQSQLPPTIYRVRIHGQAGIGFTKFASGWVPAPFIDSLGTEVSFDAQKRALGKISISDDDKHMAHIKTDRRLMMFGPEGFREAPANHRLVVVMGNNPEEFFDGIDNALGKVSGAKAALEARGFELQLLKALLGLRDEELAVSGLEIKLGKLKKTAATDVDNQIKEEDEEDEEDTDEKEEKVIVIIEEVAVGGVQ